MQQAAPGDDESVLQRVLGPPAIAQDPVRDGVEDITDLVHQDGEGLAIAASGLLDEVSIHPSTSGSPRPGWPRTTHYDGRSRAERSGPSVRRHPPRPASQPLRPRASTGHTSAGPSPRSATNVSNKSTTGQTWFGMTVTMSPRPGRSTPGRAMTTP